MVTRTSSKNQQQGSVAPFAIAASVAAALVAVWFAQPGAVVLLIGLVITAWIEPPPPPFTGQKNAQGTPQPANEKEEANQRRWQIISLMRTRLLTPHKGWVPGKPLIASWFLAVLLGGLAFLLPVSDELIETDVFWMRLANAAAAFLATTGVLGARREVTECPGVRTDSLHRASKLGMIGGGVVGLVVGALAAWFGVPALREAGVVLFMEPVGQGLLVLLGLGLGASVAWRSAALEHWREIMERRKEWQPRWVALKQNTPPRLYETEQVGAARVDFFHSDLGAQTLIDLGPKITPLLGAGMRIGCLTVPNQSGGQDVPGSVHPNRFAVAQWPEDQWPDLADPELPAEVRVLAARTEWQPRWKQLKMDPAMLLDSRIEHGYRIDTFSAGAVGAVTFWPLAPKIAPMVGSANLAVVPAEMEGPGTRHQTQFEIWQWKGHPDVKAPDCSPEAALAAIKVALVKTMTEASMPHALPTSIESITSEGSPTAWCVELAFPEMSPGMKTMRDDQLFAAAAHELNQADALVDHRANNRQGCAFFGELENTEFLDEEGEDEPGEIRKMLEQLESEDHWVRVWEQVQKQGQQPPTLQHKVVATKELADGTEITRYVFVVLSGLDPTDSFGLEEKIKTAFVPSPFVAISGWTSNPGEAPGSRHAQAFCVYRSAKVVPSDPSKLAQSQASEWVLIGHVNRAFKGARLAQPEIIRSRCVTDRRSPHHIWEIQLRLYGGVTLADLRSARNRLRQTFGCEWLRVTEDDGRILLYVGGSPDEAKLSVPSRDKLRIAALDWEQAWLDSKVSGAGGLLPLLTEVGNMPRNQQVQVLDFDLPSGIAISDVKDAIPKLKTATNMSFIEVREIPGSASRMQLFACEVDPMPTKAAYDYEFVEQSAKIPFATGVEGEPLEWEWKRSPHLLVCGTTGGGKSVALQMILEGVVARNAELFVIDPSKGAADFRFIEPWSRFMAVDIFESAALMKGIYQEVVRRKNLNSKYGVGSYTDLPESIRPPHVVVVLDEFTSLIETEKVARQPLDDFELERERQAVLAMNEARVQIGQLAGRITREARSAGISLILATQQLKANMLNDIPGGSSVKNNAARILLGRTTYGERSSALRSPDAAPQLGNFVPPGRGILEPSDSGPVIMQTWFDSTEKLQEWLDRFPKVTEKFDITPFMRKPLNDENEEETRAIDLNEVGFPQSSNDLQEIEFTLDDSAVGDVEEFDLSSLVLEDDAESESEPEDTLSGELKWDLPPANEGEENIMQEIDWTTLVEDGENEPEVPTDLDDELPEPEPTIEEVVEDPIDALGEEDSVVTDSVPDKSEETLNQPVWDDLEWGDAEEPETPNVEVVIDDFEDESVTQSTSGSYSAEGVKKQFFADEF